jgi:hypothetical protein
MEGSHRRTGEEGEVVKAVCPPPGTPENVSSFVDTVVINFVLTVLFQIDYKIGDGRRGTVLSLQILALATLPYTAITLKGYLFTHA